MRATLVESGPKVDIPQLTPSQKEDMQAYFELYEKNAEALREKSKKDLETHPAFSELIKSMPEEVMEEMNRVSLELQRKAIYFDEWEPYLKNLTDQGIQYARMGIDLRSWYSILRLVRDYMDPILEKEYHNDIQYASKANRGMNLFFDIGMSTLGESFIVERNRIIDKQNEKQQAMIRELESFAYIISHDLKTPLRGIASLSDWIVSDYASKLDEQGKEYLALLKDRVKRLELLIDGVLTYSRADRSDEEKVPVNLELVVKDVINLLAVPPNVTIYIDNLLPTIHAVPSSMTQLFSNLISNAIQHNDKEAIVISIGCTDEGEFYKFYVSDNGPGIEEEYRDKVFKIFQTLKPKDETGSTGIGLAVVKKIVDGSGGKIWIASEQGKGCTFFFTLKK